MPYLAPQRVFPPPPPPPPAPLEKFLLRLERDGDTLDLPLSADVDDHVWCVGPGIEGLDLPASSILQQRSAGMFGSHFVGVDVDAREVFLPLMVRAQDMTEWLTRRDEFNKISSAYADRSVRIFAQRPDGTVRWIDGYRGGDAPVWDLTNWIPRIAWQKFGATFVCVDPWWRGTPTERSWVGVADTPDFFPILPINLAPSSIFDTPVEVNVAGDVQTPPLWTLTGPFTAVTATHVESGRSWTIDATVTAGQTVIVNTDPRGGVESPRVTGPAGQSWWSKVNQPYDLWPLPVGPQHVEVVVTGVEVGTSVHMSVPSLWETA